MSLGLNPAEKTARPPVQGRLCAHHSSAVGGSCRRRWGRVTWGLQSGLAPTLVNCPEDLAHYGNGVNGLE